MRVNRRYVMAATTFVLAAATGHVMQRGAAPARTDGQQTSAAVPLIDQSTPIVLLSAGPAVPGDLPALPKGPMAGPLVLRADTGLAARVGRLDVAPTSGATAADVQYSAFGFACAEPGLSVTRPADGALSLMVDAPCDAGRALRVSLGDLTLDARTDEAGQLTLDLPDLGGADSLTVALDGGLPVTASVPAVSGPGAAAVALRWAGAASFDLGARLADGTPARQPVTYRFGTGPAAETVLYLSLTGAGAEFDLDVMAEITPDTCGKTVTASLLHLGGADRMAEAVSFDLPDCSAVGDLVLLPVRIAPLELARN
jgi:hypothetical protein